VASNKPRCGHQRGQQCPDRSNPSACQRLASGGQNLVKKSSEQGIRVGPHVNKSDIKALKDMVNIANQFSIHDNHSED